MSTDRPMGLILDMPFDQYLAVEAFSNSDMRLLARSAWHWKNRVPVKQTRPMLCGSLAHCAQLEPHALGTRYVFVPETHPQARPRRSGTLRSPTSPAWPPRHGGRSSWTPSTAARS
jgi:hypothetical protein